MQRFRGNKQKLPSFADSCWTILPLLLWLMGGIWAFPSSFPIPFKNCPAAFQKLLGIFQQLLAVPIGYPKTLKSFSQCLSAISILFSEGLHFC
jgi:hypothetical protein